MQSEAHAPLPLNFMEETAKGDPREHAAGASSDFQAMRSNTIPTRISGDGDARHAVGDSFCPTVAMRAPGTRTEAVATVCI